MSVATVACRAQVGLSAPLVHVEVSLGSGLPMFSIVGLPATVVKESRERVRSARPTSRLEFPAGRITVNLAPADLPKEGGRFDLPIALGILVASGQLTAPPPPSRTAFSVAEFYGELGLGGELKPVRGLLLAAAHASGHGHELIVPRANAEEACLIARVPVRAARHLLEVCAHVAGRTPLSQWSAVRRLRPGRSTAAQAGLDLSDVRGQFHAKRALVIAAAGSHSLLLLGPPGAGKTMLAQRLPGLLPPLTQAESLEVACIASVSTVGFSASSFGRRPFRTPHHTASAAALVGGGTRSRPGEISLAHHGVLFLDELPEFQRRGVGALRRPPGKGGGAGLRAALASPEPAAR